MFLMFVITTFSENRRMNCNIVLFQVIGKACLGFPVAGNALYESADCPSPVPCLSDLSSAADQSLTSLAAPGQTLLCPGDHPDGLMCPH